MQIHIAVIPNLRNFEHLSDALHGCGACEGYGREGYILLHICAVVFVGVAARVETHNLRARGGSTTTDVRRLSGSIKCQTYGREEQYG